MSFLPRGPLRSALVIGLLGVIASAHATEGGGSVYPNGAENFAAGAMPPPGTYGMLFAQRYSAGRVNDEHGHDLHVPGFKLTANVLAPRFSWVTDVKFLGGDLALHAIVPIVNVEVSVAGRSQTKTGIGDITTGPGLGYHYGDKLHAVLAVDFYLPTGAYSKNDLANIGRNYYAIEPLYIFSYLDGNGFNGDVKGGYIVNRRNRDTGIGSGDEFHFDFAAGWAVGRQLIIGAGGYYYQQTTPDRQGGADLADSKGRAFAIGPSMKYDSGRGWFTTLKWQKELRSQNRAQGDAWWVKLVFPL